MLSHYQGHVTRLNQNARLRIKVMSSRKQPLRLLAAPQHPRHLHLLW